MAGTVSINGTVNQIPQGPFQIGPLTLTPNSSNELASTNIKLANGANTITIPTWAAYILIVPDPTNAVVMTLKGVSGDTGIPLSLTGPSVVSLGASPPANFVLTSTGAGATYTNIVFF